MSRAEPITRPPLPNEQNRAYQIGEAGKIRHEVLEYLNGPGLDIGCGPDKVHRNVIGVDRGGAEVSCFGRPFQTNIVIPDASKLDVFGTEAFEFVFSSHLLEHFEEPQKVLREWWRVLKVGGHLVLYLPEPDLYRAAMQGDSLGQNKDHKRDVYPEDVRDWMSGAPGGWDLLRDEVRGHGDEYSFLLVYQKTGKGKPKRNLADAPKAEKRAAVVRYGGIGDHIMTRAILPVLKAEGYEVTYVTNPAGKEQMRSDPCIDHFITDTAALNDGELMAFWETLRPRYHLFLNMMNSVENVCLPQPHQGTHRLSRTLREALFNLNYFETTFAQAELPMPNPPDVNWYGTAEEAKWAQTERAKCPGPVLVLALTGSAIHKAYPWWPRVVADLLAAHPTLTVVSVGGQKDVALYADFPEDARHWRKAGAWTIRETLAFAQAADVVVGPETGVLNAVSMRPEVSKVVLLSHSSEENLTKYWQGPYTALTPDPSFAPCAPCHQLHWDWHACHRDEATGAALCAAGIEPFDVVAAVGQHLIGQQKEQEAA